MCPPEFASGAVLESYLAVIAEIARCIGVTCPDVGSPHQEHLLRMRSRLAFAADEQTLAETREAIRNELRAFAERARVLHERREDGLPRILNAFSQVTGVLGERNEAGCRQFAEFSARVKEVAETMPWPDARDTLREMVSAAGSQVDVLRLDSQLAQAHVEEQMRVLRSRLATRNPQQLDLLTGLGNRQAVEEQMARRVKNGKPFALLLFQTGGLAGIAEKEGPAAADQVLVQAVSRLTGQVRANDYLGRWDASEFAIVMECSLETATSRAQQIARWLSGTYLLRGGAAETRVKAAFTVRVVDPCASAHAEPETSLLPA